ncbi:uncharacterized protein [Aegilops tauschii subsp. strangulata]|uniref:uncharacterized protein n=1 Tax=Aegilops tauschii subsp. strangulata TaxID=200361 RepID=UPI003CC846D6
MVVAQQMLSNQVCVSTLLLMELKASSKASSSSYLYMQGTEISKYIWSILVFFLMRNMLNNHLNDSNVSSYKSAAPKMTISLKWLKPTIFIAYGSACLGFALNMEDDQKKDRAKGS